MRIKKAVSEENIVKVFGLLCLFLFGILFYYCMGMTGSSTLHNEHIQFKTDSLLNNIFRLFAAAMVLYMLNGLYERLLWQRKRNLFLVVGCMLSLCFSIYWVGASGTGPQADQGMICRCASAFNKGDFSYFDKGEYLAVYPHQLGLVTWMRGIFYLFGDGNYKAFQYFSACMVPLILFSGCQILRKISGDNETAEFYYLILAVTCFPMYAYVPFVYGEICSTALGLFSVWLLLSCMEKFSWFRVVLLGLSAGIAVQMRKNTLILIIALCITIVIRMCAGIRRELVCTGIAVILGVLLCQMAVNGLYQNVRRQDTGAVSALLYIVMGLHDDYGYPGWYNGYTLRVLEEYDYNTEAANRRALEDSAVFRNLYRADPDYAVDFFVRKINAQWNVPMWQCISMNSDIVEEQGRLASNIYQEGRIGKLVESSMKTSQLVIYGGILFLLIYSWKKKTDICFYVLLIAVFGGFLFSLMWEAKTRYNFPYFLFMLPYGAIGVQMILQDIQDKMNFFLRKRRLDRNRTDDIMSNNERQRMQR